MRTYTVTKKKGSGEICYSIGTVSYCFKKGQTKFRGVPELVAVRAELDYGFKIKLEIETAEPEELVLVEEVETLDLEEEEN